MSSKPSALAPFLIERYMDDNQPLAKLDLAETCCSSLSLQEIAELSSTSLPPFPTSKRLTYGEIPGTPELRQRIANRYAAGLSADNILVTNGTIGANYNVFYSLLLEGESEHDGKNEVVCMYPVYQQLYAVPESLGYNVRLWKLRPENGWAADIEELKGLLSSKTRLLILCNPNNPTGSYLNEKQLKQIVDLAKALDIPILCDEVYSGVYHSVEKPPSIVHLYEKGISTCSLSKSYSAAGLRLGWIASKSKEIIARALDARHYTAISVSMLDDHYAAYILSPDVGPKILENNVAMARKNLQILKAFVEQHPQLRFVPPVAGTTAFIDFSSILKEMSDWEFCEELIRKTGVLVGPGRAFGRGKEFLGWVRIGYCCSTETLERGLETLGRYLREQNYI